MELTATVLIIGFLIWVLGFIGRSTGTVIDILGWGLVGDRGLAIYTTIVLGIVLGLFAVYYGIQRGLAWTKPVQRAVLKIPVIGKALETISLSRLAWSMHLTFDTGMSVRKALKLSIESTRNAHFTDQINLIDRAIEGGQSIYDTFVLTGAFPDDFLDSLHAGEESGRLVESMGRLSRQYQEQAEAAIPYAHRVRRVCRFRIRGRDRHLPDLPNFLRLHRTTPTIHVTHGRLGRSNSLECGDASPLCCGWRCRGGLAAFCPLIESGDASPHSEVLVFRTSIPTGEAVMSLTIVRMDEGIGAIRLGGARWSRCGMPTLWAAEAKKEKAADNPKVVARCENIAQGDKRSQEETRIVAQ